MSIAGLGTYNSSSSYYYKCITKSRSGSLSNLSDDFVNQKISDDDPMHDFKEAARKVITSAPYCKCIVANIKTEELYASENESGEMMYSYEKTEQSLQIFIKYDGHDKTYTVKGYDKDGNLFEKDINPEDVDPEYADFPEFSALCMYFEQTEETAEFLEDDYFDTDDILEKMDYLEKINNLKNGSLDFRGISLKQSFTQALEQRYNRRISVGKQDDFANMSVSIFFRCDSDDARAIIEKTIITMLTNVGIALAPAFGAQRVAAESVISLGITDYSVMRNVGMEVVSKLGMYGGGLCRE